MGVNLLSVKYEHALEQEILILFCLVSEQQLLPSLHKKLLGGITFGYVQCHGSDVSTWVCKSVLTCTYA